MHVTKLIDEGVYITEYMYTNKLPSHNRSKGHSQTLRQHFLKHYNTDNTDFYGEGCFFAIHPNVTNILRL